MDDQQPEAKDGDNIQVGNIENSNVVAVGAGATAVYNAGLSTEAVAALVVELKRVDQPEVWDGRFPYLGLTAFQENDAQFFFGREGLVDELLERVQEARFIVIAGPSGSGKSSVARAGLFHALREGRLDKSDSWLLATMQPKGDPIEQLALAMARLAKSPGAGDHLRQQGRENPLALHEQIETLLGDDDRQRCILLVDQFEETFTQTKEEDRAPFIDLLTRAAGVENGRLTVILSLRADFVSHCARYPDLRALMSQQFQLVGAMDPPDLAKAITLPALEVGVKIDAELVSRIMADMKGEPGALPLMSFALRDLFEAEKSATGEEMDITLPEYLDRGGIERALERHANKVFDNFSDEQKALARGVFSKLIEVGQGRADTRRTATFTELIPAGATQETVEAVVTALAKEGVRLITTSGDEMTSDNRNSGTVTIAHEKLIDAWPWLRQLVDENRDMIILQNEINNDAQAWAQEKDIGFLYRGGRLIQVEEQLEMSNPDLNKLSKEFIQASLDQREKEIKEKEASRRKTITILVTAFGVSLVFAAVAILFFLRSNDSAKTANENLATATAALIMAETANAEAVFQRNEAATSEANALAREEVALAAGTAEANALAISEVSEERALKQAQLAEARALAAQAETAIERNDPQSAYLLAIQAVDSYENNGSPAAEAEVALAKALTEIQEQAILDEHKDTVVSANFNHDGSRILTASDDGIARLWDERGMFIAALEGHTNSVNSTVFNHDGSRIVTGGSDGTARLWDGSGAFIALLSGHAGSVNSAAFNHDGSRVITSSSDGTARLWNGSGTLITVFIGHAGSVNSAAFNHDGSRIITSSSDGTARLWDKDGSFIIALEGHTDRVNSAVFNHDGSRIVTASSDRTARLWNNEGDSLAILSGHTGLVRSAIFNHDGSRIITASRDRTARLWNQDGTFIIALEGHIGVVTSAIFNYDGSRIVTASEDRTARLWDENGTFISALEGHTAPVISAAFNHDGSNIVTASEDKTARLWDSNDTLITALIGHTDWVGSAAFNYDSNRIVTASGDQTARLWNGDGAFITILDGHTGPIILAAFSHDGSRIVTASADGTARLWDENGIFISALEGHENEVIAAAFNHDGSRIITTSKDETARLWDENGIFISALEGHLGWVVAGAFNHDDSRIITTGMDETARLWDGNGAFIATLEGHMDRVTSAAFNHNSSRIVTTSKDNTARLWDENGTLISILEGHEDWVWSAVFNHDGSRIITASKDGTARLWDDNGVFITALEGHTGWVWSAVFNHDGSRIVTASDDWTARVWDSNGTFITALDGHAERVTSAAFNHDGSRIITASDDGNPRLWEVFSFVEEMRAEAIRRLLFFLTEDECREYFDAATCQPDL